MIAFLRYTKVRGPPEVSLRSGHSGFSHACKITIELASVQCTLVPEPVFVELLRSPIRIDSQPGGPV